MQRGTVTSTLLGDDQYRYNRSKACSLLSVRIPQSQSNLGWNGFYHDIMQPASTLNHHHCILARRTPVEYNYPHAQTTIKNSHKRHRFLTCHWSPPHLWASLKKKNHKRTNPRAKQKHPKPRRLGARSLNKGRSTTLCLVAHRGQRQCKWSQLSWSGDYFWPRKYLKPSRILHV